VPSLFARTADTNEAAAVATLRAIAVAQAQFHAGGSLDANEDTEPEFGSLGELAGVAPLRDGGGVKLNENLLSESVAAVDADGHVLLHGYLFCLYLPDKDGKGVVGVAGNRARIDPGLAHHYWTCLAWPVERGTTGNRSFFINQEGRILSTFRPVYSGKIEKPPAGAGLVAMLADEIRSGNLATGIRGADGQTWVEVDGR
jgi:hypothetical protein